MREIVLGEHPGALSAYPDATFDSIVTDGPYELRFMGREWDGSGIVFDPAFWAECLRVLKPGGHLVNFCAPRTYHRMACAVEDGGFEIRDCLMWLFGSGFPKSLDVSKAIDKAAGAERYERAAFGGSFSDDGGSTYGTAISGVPITDTAKEWVGWGTALKPAYEPIVLARKPLSGTVAGNVLEHGTGALNIDGCRIEGEGGRAREGERSQERRYTERGGTNFAPHPGPRGGDPSGRWPANLLLDDQVGAILDDQAGTDCGAGYYRNTPRPGKHTDIYGRFNGGGEKGASDADGGPSRFFYCPKASKDERDGSKHPTVKPVTLMRWLARLVTPKGGLVLDPFCGSGTTGVACEREGFRYVLIDKDPVSVEDALRRCAIARSRITPDLFSEIEVSA